jgi:hypothetical protein
VGLARVRVRVPPIPQAQALGTATEVAAEDSVLQTVRANLRHPLASRPLDRQALKGPRLCRRRRLDRHRRVHHHP